MTTNITLVMVGTTGVAVRFIARRHAGSRLGLDDWLILVAWILFGALCGLTVFGVLNGAGRHKQYILQTDPGKLEKYLQFVYGFKLLYPCISGLIKASICWSYLRKLGHIKSLRWFGYSLLTTTVLWALAMFVLSVLQCHHVQEFWKSKGERSKCTGLQEYFISMSVVGVCVDAVILFIIVQPIWHFSMCIGKKTILLCTVILAVSKICFCIVRIVELWNLKDFNITWDYTGPIIWMITEVTVGLLAACCPVLEAFLPERPMQQLSVMLSGQEGAGSTDRNRSLSWSEKTINWIERKRGFHRSSEVQEDGTEKIMQHGIMRTFSNTVEIEDMRRVSPVATV
ncbi:unnamed protein product [Periconia digitata]|uniref:Rhodopsin domain-containing protein n=1 Tax=Periconia digitata TaxID=1303443 RepID=A0A9W4UVJ6_9PLEO|nr:unnamed protein product [Periconia digitata]